MIGLGYVGLPLAVEFAKKYPVVGFDINKTRIDQLREGHDHTMEIEDDQLKKISTRILESQGLYCTDTITDIVPAIIIL